MSSTRLQHYDVTSCKERHLIVKRYWCKGVLFCYNHRKFGKVSFMGEGVITFSKKVHVFLRHPVEFTLSVCVCLCVPESCMTNNLAVHDGIENHSAQMIIMTR